MNVEALKSERVADFISYCKKHKQEVDDSFLYDEDLKDFVPNVDNPTYIISNQHGEIIAAASLIIEDYFRRGSKARFRIFHSELEEIACYDMLMKQILKHTGGLDKVFLFVQLTNGALKKFMEELNFTVERYTFVVVREEMDVPPYTLPEGYEIMTFRQGMDERTWCEVRNAGFAKLLGSETPLIQADVERMLSSEEHIEEGMLILYEKERPVGVVRGSQEDDFESTPIMNFGPLAIIPEYEGKGLGRILLRASLHFAKKKNYAKTILSVNGENERAKALYLQEGFKQVEGVICYEYHL
ncbi:GNAT family N-acetyltransferase [Paenisporosarcina indica]|uniref:GNAT family N-acetyltransferase n=1 Tax=Paenisporosarcina indica TaxID=650093 RepID=UPI00094FC437|nr:GNAT family N-acetyltransferase [Paenisporosarcina indica]